jgi:hypothetical protein
MRRRQAADAAACDQDRQGLTVRLRHHHSQNCNAVSGDILSSFRPSFNCVVVQSLGNKKRAA